MSTMIAPLKPLDGATEIEIPHDLLATGPLTADANVAIRGDVRPGAVLRATGIVRVDGSIDSATITCTGELLVTAGSIVGGRISAYVGITCDVAGDRQGTSTVLTIGMDEQLLDLAEKRVDEVARTREKAKEMRDKLTPMLKTVKDLRPDQREKVTLLLCQTSEADERADIAEAKMLNRVLAMTTQLTPYCVVTGTLFPGVTLRLPGISATIDQIIKGPIQLFASRENNTIKVVANELSTGITRTLRSDVCSSRLETILAKLGKK